MSRQVKTCRNFPCFVNTSPDKTCQDQTIQDKRGKIRLVKTCQAQTCKDKEPKARLKKTKQDWKRIVKTRQDEIHQFKSGFLKSCQNNSIQYKI